MKITPKEFCEVFNRGDIKAIGRMYIRLGLKDADINLLLPFPMNDKGFEAIIFAGYSAVKCAVWYIAVGDKRIPGKAFRLRSDGKECFEEFASTIPNRKFAEGLKEQFVKCFHSAVLPAEWDN